MHPSQSQTIVRRRHPEVVLSQLTRSSSPRRCCALDHLKALRRARYPGNTARFHHDDLRVPLLPTCLRLADLASCAVSVALLCVSDTAAAVPSSDRSLPLLHDILSSQPNDAYRVVAQGIVPDETAEIAESVKAWVQMGVDLILTSGGTGMGTRDRTPEVRSLSLPRFGRLSQRYLRVLSQAIAPLIDRPAPGLVIAMLTSSLAITPLAALSRPVAGIVHSPSGDGTGSLIVTLPGSPKAAKENLECLLKILPHALELAGGVRSRTTAVHERLQRGEDGMKGVQEAVTQHTHRHEAPHAATHSHAHGHPHSHQSHSHEHVHHGHHAPRPRMLTSQDPSSSSAFPFTYAKNTALTAFPGSRVPTAQVALATRLYPRCCIPHLPAHAALARSDAPG